MWTVSVRSYVGTSANIVAEEKQTLLPNSQVESPARWQTWLLSWKSSEKYISTESQKYNFHNQTNTNGEVKSLPGGGKLGFFLGKVGTSSCFCFLSIDNLDFPRSNWPRVIKMSSPHSTQVVSWYQIVQTSDLWSQVCPLLLTSTPQWPCCQIADNSTKIVSKKAWEEEGQM